MADTSKLVQFFTGSAKPENANVNGLYFIVANGAGKLYKGDTLIAETNDTAAMTSLQNSITAINTALDTKATKTELNEHIALYEALLAVVNGHTNSIQANGQAIEGILNDANVDSFADVVAELAKKQDKGDYATKNEAQQYADNAAAGVRSYVGELPADAGVDTVIAYIQKLTSGIASEGTVSALAGRVEQAEKDIDAIEADYLKGADKTALEGKINAEETRAKAAEEANTALINGLAGSKADKTALEAEISRATGAEEALSDRLDEVEAFFELTEEEQLDTALDTLVEIQKFINSEAGVADQMLLDIAANAKAITDEAKARDDADKALAQQISGVAGAVATKAEASDLQATQGEVDAVEGRMDTAEGKITALESKVGGTSVSDQIDAKIDALDIETYAKQADLTAEANRAIGVENSIIAALSWQTL